MLRKLAALYFPLYCFLLVAGHEFITVLFTAQYLDSWPIFAINLTIIPLTLISSAYDPVLRAYPEHMPFLLKTRIALAVPLILGLWFGTEYYGLVGAITATVVVNAVERVILAAKVGKILKTSWHDLVLLKDIGKFAYAAATAGVLVGLVRQLLVGMDPSAMLGTCGVVFAMAYGATVMLLGVLTPREREAIGRFKFWKRAEDSLA